MRYPEKFLLKLPDGWLSRIDGVSGNRSEFIREAIGVALGVDGPSGSVSDKVPEKVGRPDPVPGVPASGVLVNRKGSVVDPAGLRPDAVVLLAALRKKRMTSQGAEREMGWMGLRYSRAEGELLSSGLAWLDGGILCASAE